MDNKYISIPSKVYLDRNLPPRTVLLYGFIAALQKDGSCWANNPFLFGALRRFERIAFPGASHS